jgi:hypothetical protein
MQRFLTNGYTISRADIRMVLKTVVRWGLLELREGWHTWGKEEPDETPMPKPTAQSYPANAGEAQIPSAK